MKVHEEKNGYECDECGKLFPTSKQLMRHRTSKDGTCNFVCSFCRVNFSKFQTLVEHMNKMHEKQTRNLKNEMKILIGTTLNSLKQGLRIGMKLKPLLINLANFDGVHYRISMPNVETSMVLFSSSLKCYKNLDMKIVNESMKTADGNLLSPPEEGFDVSVEIGLIDISNNWIDQWLTYNENLRNENHQDNHIHIVKNE